MTTMMLSLCDEGGSETRAWQWRRQTENIKCGSQQQQQQQYHRCLLAAAHDVSSTVVH